MSTVLNTRLAKALDAKREAWMQLEILEGLGRDPSVGRDIAFDAYSDARKRHADIIKDEWELRHMERSADRIRAGVHQTRELEQAI